jgi:hypothetical protein
VTFIGKKRGTLVWLLTAGLALGAGLVYADDPAPSGPSPEMLSRAREAGVTPEVRKGVTVYCWKDATVGTRFVTKKCVNEDQLEMLIVQRQAARDLMNRGGGNHP